MSPLVAKRPLEQRGCSLVPLSLRPAPTEEGPSCVLPWSPDSALKRQRTHASERENEHSSGKNGSALPRDSCPPRVSPLPAWHQAVSNLCPDDGVPERAPGSVPAERDHLRNPSPLLTLRGSQECLEAVPRLTGGTLEDPPAVSLAGVREHAGERGHWREAVGLRGDRDGAPWGWDCGPSCTQQTLRAHHPRLALGLGHDSPCPPPGETQCLWKAGRKRQLMHSMWTPSGTSRAREEREPVVKAWGEDSCAFDATYSHPHTAPEHAVHAGAGRSPNVWADPPDQSERPIDKGAGMRVAEWGSALERSEGGQWCMSPREVEGVQCRPSLPGIRGCEFPCEGQATLTRVRQLEGALRECEEAWHAESSLVAAACLSPAHPAARAVYGPGSVPGQARVGGPLSVPGLSLVGGTQSLKHGLMRTQWSPRLLLNGFKPRKGGHTTSELAQSPVDDLMSRLCLGRRTPVVALWQPQPVSGYPTPDSSVWDPQGSPESDSEGSTADRRARRAGANGRVQQSSGVCRRAEEGEGDEGAGSQEGETAEWRPRSRVNDWREGHWREAHGDDDEERADQENQEGQGGGRRPSSWQEGQWLPPKAHGKEDGEGGKGECLEAQWAQRLPPTKARGEEGAMLSHPGEAISPKDGSPSDVAASSKGSARPPALLVTARGCGGHHLLGESSRPGLKAGGRGASEPQPRAGKMLGDDSAEVGALGNTALLEGCRYAAPLLCGTKRPLGWDSLGSSVTLGVYTERHLGCGRAGDACRLPWGSYPQGVFPQGAYPQGHQKGILAPWVMEVQGRARKAPCYSLRKGERPQSAAREALLAGPAVHSLEGGCEHVRKRRQGKTLWEEQARLMLCKRPKA